VTRPLIEPTTGRELVKQGFGQQQLYRRPTPPGGTGGGCGPWTDVGTTPPFQNSWTNVGAPWQGLRFRLCDDDFEIEGFVQGGADCSVVFTIPLADRPDADLAIVGIDASGDVVYWLVDASTGEVSLCLAACLTGNSGPTGPTGGTGPTGTQGVSLGPIDYLWDNSTASSDPGSGHLKYNNATVASVTNIFISETDHRANGIAALIQSWDDSTHTALRGTLYILKADQPSVMAVFSVSGSITDNGTWDTIPVTHVVSSGTLTDEDEVLVWFSRTGDDGAAGAAGATGPTGPTGASGGGVAVDVQSFTTAGTFSGASGWQKPAGTTVACIIGYGGGGQGGGGSLSATTGTGGSGGGGGARVEKIMLVTSLATQETVVVGAGGSTGSGAANGQAGGNSSCSSVVAGGGGGGFSGNVSSASGGGGGGAGTAGAVGASGATSRGGGSVAAGTVGVGNAGAGGDTAVQPGHAADEGGGSGGRSNQNAAVPGTGGTSNFGGAGGGAGGVGRAAPQTGGAGGNSGTWDDTNGGGGAAGGTTGNVGGTGNNGDTRKGGQGGGGGGGVAAGTAGNGGPGGARGGGGGGGGGTTTGGTVGTGGVGGAGAIYVISW
jgi:hypothetical protein